MQTVTQQTQQSIIDAEITITFKKLIELLNESSNDNSDEILGVVEEAQGMHNESV